MRKGLFLLYGLMAMLVSCENPVITDDVEEEASGNLRVKVYQLEQTPFSELSRATLADACTRLNYAVYTLEGMRVKQINQEKTAENFGTASFQLEPETYQLVVVAHSSNGNPTMTNPAKIQFTNATGYSDTFLYSQEVTLGEEPVELSLTLNRIVALCRFVITDDYPEDAARIKFYYTGGSGAFDAKTGLGSVNSKQEHTFDIIPGQKQFDLYTILHNIEGTIHLQVTAYGKNDNVLCERTFDVPMKRNHITWLTGDYFTGGEGSMNIDIRINADWDGESHISF
ncbi:MAG: hypothetical protein J6W52_05590 [Bacteroidaceae bacterium]|nr:hypothetical protein [Bacteroidaceae bacterium]